MDLPNYLAAIPGLFFGMLVLGPLLRWALALWTVVKEQRRDTQHRSLWRIVPVLFLSSGPWLLSAAIIFTHYMLRPPRADAWNWFFGAALCAPLVFLITIYSMLSKVRKKKLARP